MKFVAVSAIYPCQSEKIDEILQEAKPAKSYVQIPYSKIYKTKNRKHRRTASKLAACAKPPNAVNSRDGGI